MYRTHKGRRLKRFGASLALATGLVAGGAAIASASTSSAAHTATHHARHHGLPGPHWHDGPGAFGQITALSATSITVSGPDSHSATFSINSSTTVRKGHAAGAVSDLATGENVAVVPSTSDATVASNILIQLPHLGGKVVSVTGSTIVVQDRDGFYRTINTDGSTTFRKSDAAGSLSDVTVGSFVVAEGTIDADHTSLDATSVGVGVPGGGPGGEGHGPGGPDF